MKEWIPLLKDWVPLFQTLSWIGLIAFMVFKFASKLESLLEIVLNRVKSGSSLKAGPVELGEDLRSLDKVSANSSDAPVSEDGWSAERDGIYQSNNGLFLAHVIEPSKKHGQEYDIFIYLVRHRGSDFSDIEYAEFFFGSYWGNRVFKESLKNNLLGVSTSAYGPFLCTCHVKMKNGNEVRLNRYIDFEMSRVFENV